MMNNLKNIKYIRLMLQIDRRRQFDLLGLLIIMILTSFAEMLSIGAIIPFLTALTSPERFSNNKYVKIFFESLGVYNQSQILLLLVVIFCSVVIFAALMRMLLVWSQARVAYALGEKIAIDVYRRILYQPYVEHLARSSSQVINDVYGKAANISTSIILPCVTIVHAFIMLSFILTMLVAIDPETILLALIGFGLSYFLVVVFTHKQIFDNGRLVAEQAARVIKSLQEGIGGIRDIIIDNTQEIFCSTFHRADTMMRAAQIRNAFISQSPRFVMEALGMCLIALIACAKSANPGGLNDAIPVLGAIALGAQRMLPTIQQLFQSWATIQSNKSSLEDVLLLLEKPKPATKKNTIITKKLAFNNYISIKNLSFRYSKEREWVIKNINLDIPKGSKIGLIGVTGSGKSTLIDLIMGLLMPTRGEVMIDGIVLDDSTVAAWQSRIAHVPQSVFLADISIAENIAFGLPENLIDFERVHSAAKKAQIYNDIQRFPKKFATIVGERGGRLSGGQRQRIGVARALYKDASVLILDEATSALDSETEKELMASINQSENNLTIIIIAHRLSTLENCDVIYDLSRGLISRSFPVQDFGINV